MYHHSTELGTLPPPLRKHGQGQKNNGHTGSPCVDKPVLARDAQHKETLHTEKLPVSHTKMAINKTRKRFQSALYVLLCVFVLSWDKSIFHLIPGG